MSTIIRLQDCPLILTELSPIRLQQDCPWVLTYLQSCGLWEKTEERLAGKLQDTVWSLTGSRRITQFPRPVGGDAARTWLLIGRRHKPFYSDYSEKDIYGDFSIKSLRTPLAINIFQKKILTMCGFVPRLCSFLTDLSCRLPRLLG